MSNVIEVIFEGISEYASIQVLLHLTSVSTSVASIECTEDAVSISDEGISIEFLELVHRFDSDVCVLVKLQGMKIGEIVFPAVLLRLVKYDDQIDVDFSFDANEIQDLNVPFLIKCLHEYAKKTADEFSVDKFFCGMEPASDCITRYFTNRTIGPLTWD